MAVQFGIDTFGVHILESKGSENLSFLAAFRGKPFDAVDVSLAPDAPRFPRRETNYVTLVVARLPNPFDSTVAQRFIDRGFPSHRRLVRRVLVVAHLVRLSENCIRPGYCW